MRIEPIGPDAWNLWRLLRLRALRESPDSFSSSYAEASGPKDNETYWRGYFAANGQNYLVTLDSEPVGQVRVVAFDGRSDAGLMSLWVAPEARGNGIGTALTEACWDWLQGRHPGRPLSLSVRRHNVTARRLYERSGFMFCQRHPEDDSADLLIRHVAR